MFVQQRDHEIDVAEEPIRKGHVGLIVAGSMITGFVVAPTLVIGPFGGAQEHVVVGTALLGWAFGWALLAGLSAVWTDEPRRWAVVPAAVMAVSGGSLLIFRPVAIVGVGNVVIDATAVASRSPVPPPHPPSPWSATATGSMTHVSTAVPGVSGSTLGAQLTGGVAGTGPRGTVTLDGALSDWRVDPAAAAVNQKSLTLGGRWMLRPRRVLMGRSEFEVNRVQHLQYRTTTIGGLGYFVVKSTRVSLLLAPGIGYGKSEQPALGRVLSFAAGVAPGVQGPITGGHDLLTVQMTPTLSFQQDMHYFWGLREPLRQAQFNAKLLGMVSAHFGLSIAFKEIYDSSLPPPVERSLRSLVSGVQLKF